MSWVQKVCKIQPGHEVCFASSFMRQVGIIDAQTAGARGIVKEIIPGMHGAPDRAVIDWRGADLPERMAVGTLTRVTGKGIADE